MPSKKMTVRAIFGTADKKREASQPSTPLSGAGSLVAYERDEAGKRVQVEAITVRTYFNERGSGMQPVRACVWIRAPRGSGADWSTGRGSASGCGYHKESAAIADALRAAGVTLYGNPYRYDPKEVDFKKVFHLGGTGSSAYREIFEAVARARGFKGPMLWTSHGL